MVWMSASMTSLASAMGMRQSLTVISNEFPMRSPICMPLAPLYASLTVTSLRSILLRSGLP